MADDSGKDTQKKSGGGRKLLVLGLLAGLLMGGLGVGGFFMLTGEEPSAEQAAETESTDTNDTESVDEADADESSARQSTAFVRLDRLSAPLINDGRVMGYVLLDLSIEVRRSDDELVVAQRLPALRAAFLRDVTENPIGKPDQPMIIDYETLTSRLRAAANRELPRPVVLRVLVTQSTRL